MQKYVFILRGNGGPMPTPEEGAKIMAAWGTWLEGMGDALVDAGEAVGASEFVGSPSDDPVSGYMVVQAEDMDAAKAIAMGCPMMNYNGRIEIAPAMEME